MLSVKLIVHVEADKIFSRVLVANTSPWDRKRMKNQPIGTLLSNYEVSVHSGVTSESMLETFRLQKLGSTSAMDTDKPCSHSISKPMNCSAGSMRVVANNIYSGEGLVWNDSQGKVC